MTREQIAKTFEGATDEQITAILNINSTDIGKAKGDFDTIKKDLETANQTITTMTQELTQAKEQGATVEALNAKIADFERAEADRKTAEAENQRRKSLDERFDKWQHKDKSGTAIPFTEAGKRIARLDFEKAIENKANTGKSDDEIIKALTFDESGNAKAGYFDTGVSVSALPGASPLPSGSGADESQIRAVMGLPPQK